MSAMTAKYVAVALLMLAGFSAALSLAFWAERRRKK